MEEILSIPNDDKKENDSSEPSSQSASSQDVELADDSDILDLGAISESNDLVPEKKKSGGLFSFFKKKPVENSFSPIDEGFQTAEPDQVSPIGSASDALQDEGSISLESSTPGSDIFQELELGDLNFGEQRQDAKIKEPVEAIVYISNALSIVFWLSLVAFLGFFISVFIRNSEASIIAKMPLACDYIGSSIEGYDNSTDCKTLSEIVAGLKKSNDSIERLLIQELSILVPKKLKANYILSSPEVKFIQEKTGNARISITRVAQDFEDIRVKSGGYDGKNIECTTMQLDEKGNLDISCNFFGTSINDATDEDKKLSSRGVALDFLSKLQSKNSNFTIVDFPTNIEISKFNGTDGIKVIFSTQTALTLKLKYSPLSTKS